MGDIVAFGARGAGVASELRFEKGLAQGAEVQVVGFVGVHYESLSGPPGGTLAQLFADLVVNCHLFHIGAQGVICAPGSNF